MRMELKNLIVMLMFLLVLVFAVSTVQAVTVITTAEELQAMADDLNGDYVLGNDIDLTGFDWQRVGPFAGTFSGANHIISGLTMDADRANLFSVLAASGVVKNVGLTNVNIRAPWYGAALVGDCYGTVSKCYVKGGTVTCVGDENRRGGNFGAVTGLIRNGGIVTDCYASDLVVTFATDLVYWNSQAGFVGGQYNVAANCYFAGTIIRSSDNGGGFLDHFSDNSVTTSCYYDMDLAGFDDGMGMGRTTAEMMTQSTFVGWDFDNTWTMIEGQTYPTLIPEPAITLYVDDDASPDGDGLSWATAFKYLKDGLTVASYGDEVRVAQGTYQPDRNSRNPTGTGSREATFQLISGVAIKGGYGGLGKPDPNKRDTKVYETILSGDLNGDDGPNFANNDENSYHVVTGSGTDPNTVLDGLIVTAGNANDEGGGIYNGEGNLTLTNCRFTGNWTSFGGGGIYNSQGKLALTNCMFSGNLATWAGGGICNIEGELTLTNCTFSGNSAWVQGGGIHNVRGELALNSCTFIGNSVDYEGGGICNDHNSLTLTNCTFIGNSSLKWGGGMHNSHFGATATNCIFIGNSADDGGGVGTYLLLENDLTLTNCTFIGNTADEYGGAVFNEREGDLTLTNCILWDNTANEGPQIAMKNDGTISIGYSCLQGGRLDVYIPEATLDWGSGNIDSDPCFVDSDNDDYHLKSQVGRWYPVSENWVVDAVTSPCIDAGNPGCDLGDELNDANNVRINMGAYGGTGKASKSPANWASLADLTNDYKVDVSDLTVFVQSWLANGQCIPSDLNRNESVNFVDFAFFADQWLWEQ